MFINHLAKVDFNAAFENIVKKLNECFIYFLADKLRNFRTPR